MDKGWQHDCGALGVVFPSPSVSLSFSASLASTHALSTTVGEKKKKGVHAHMRERKRDRESTLDRSHHALAPFPQPSSLSVSWEPAHMPDMFSRPAWDPNYSYQLASNI